MIFSQLPPALIISLIAATPVIEVRGAVPWGLLSSELSPWQVIFFSVVGSSLPIFPLLWVLSSLTQWLRQWPLADRCLAWLFQRTRHKSQLIADFELVGLLLFVAIPLPGTGVWTGCVAAYLLGLPWLGIFICATLGSLVASFIMTAITLGSLSLFF